MATIETERLVLRPWDEKDAEALYRWAKDPEVGPRAGWDPHRSVEESAQVIREVLAVPESYAIVQKASEKNEPFYVTRYLLDLAQAFNKYYYEHRIIDGSA